MTDEQKAAYILGIAIQAFAEAVGMIFENIERLSKGEALAYSDASFQELIEKHALHHNGIIGFFQGDW